MHAKNHHIIKINTTEVCLQYLEKLSKRKKKTLNIIHIPRSSTQRLFHVNITNLYIYKSPVEIVGR